MKVLFITPYITSASHPAFLRNQTGFGYMVHDIAQYVAKRSDVDLFVSMAFTPELEMDGFRVIGRSKWKIIKNLNLKSFIDSIVFNRRYRQPFKTKVRTLYIYASIAQIEKKLKQYDIVHIHGCSELTDAAIKACQRKKVPFLITLHGLNSFEETIKQNDSIRRYERDFLKEAAANHYPVSFISAGNKKTAEELTCFEADSFWVVSNGCNTTKKLIFEDIRKLYHIKDSDFVFAFVGNVSTNKNQIQVARAWKLLPDEFREKCKVLFVGQYSEDDELVRFIRKNSLEESLILCGMQPKDRVSVYYHASNATILTSITEGFGLSIIEGFVYGLPNLTFQDLPAIQEIYDDRVMLCLADRSDQSLTEGLSKMIEREWDIDIISEYSKNFSLDVMSKKYINIYSEII